MDNAITRLSSKIEEYSEEPKLIEAIQADIVKSMENKNSKKKQKEELALPSPEQIVSEENQTYCFCGKVCLGFVCLCSLLMER